MVKSIKLYNNFDIKNVHKSSILLIGNFDGLHLGHQKLFRLAKKYKKKYSSKVGVLTFEPMPKMYFNSNLKNFRLSNLNQKIEHLIRPIQQVPETKTISSLFSELKQRNEQIAITVDEFGGVAGLVTLRKLIEVIVGPVEDEEVVFKKTLNVKGENIFEVEGGMSINEANEKIGINIPEGEYQTLAGFVLEQFRHLPKNNESIQFNNFSIAIKKMDKNKIELLKITKQSNK